MKSERVAETQGLILRDAEIGAQAVVTGVLERDDCIQSVITAGELHEDEDAAVLFRARRGSERGLDEKGRGEMAESEKADAACVRPDVEVALESQDFGWVTGLEKQAEADSAALAFGVDAKTAKRLIKHPFYSYPGGHSFFDLYIDVIDGIHRLGRGSAGGRQGIGHDGPEPTHQGSRQVGQH